MNVIIVGAGQVGIFIAERLSRENHNITVIDPDEARVRRIGETLDVLALQGNGATAAMQERANVRAADLVIAVTQIDEVNMVACLTAHFYGAKRKIARVSNPDYFVTDGEGLTPQAIGIDLIIHPEQLCAQTFERLIANDTMTELQDFADGKVRLIAFTVQADSRFIGAPLSELGTEELFAHSRLVTIHRGQKTIIPRGNDTIQAGDEIFLMSSASEATKLVEETGLSHKVRSVIIAGGGRVGQNLAHLLEEGGADVRVIDNDAKHCEQMSARLRKAVIFQGDCTNLKILENAGLETADAYVAVTRDDETNILSCILAHQNGAHRTMALVSKPEYVPLLNTIPGVDVAISPRLATANEILRLVRRGKIHSVATLRNVNAEVVEFEAVAQSKAVSGPLRDVHFPSGAVIGSIVRDGLVIQPTGDVRIAPRDHVIVFTLAEVVPAVEKFFAHKRFGIL